MAGHSHWAGIKHKKAAADKKRGKLFSKLAKAIIAAAREGGGDPAQNIRLKSAIDQAKSSNMPKDNIERAIKRGSGNLEGETYEEFQYEGYAPFGVAVLIDILTDNRNRAAGEVRYIFDSHGGNLGGSVSWIFEKKGTFMIPFEGDEDKENLELLAIEGGAEDIKFSGGYCEIITSPEDYESVKSTLEDGEVKWETAELTLVPKNTVTIEEEKQARKILKMLDALDDNEDVQKIYANYEFPDDLELDDED